MGEPQYSGVSHLFQRIRDVKATQAHFLSADSDSNWRNRLSMHAARVGRCAQDYAAEPLHSVPVGASSSESNDLPVMSIDSSISAPKLAEDNSAGVDQGPTTKPASSTRRWRVRNLGVRADLVGMGLLQGSQLPIQLSTGGIFRGDLEVEAITEAFPAVSEPVTIDACDHVSAITESLAYPYVSASRGGVAVRIVPEFEFLPHSTAFNSSRIAHSYEHHIDTNFAEMQVLACVKGPTLTIVADHGALTATSLATPTGSEAGSLSRVPVTLLVVLDKSGSMADSNKLEALKSTVHFILDQLSPSDGIAITSFNSAAETVLPLGCIATPADLAHAQAQVDLLVAGGGTDISQGLSTALACFNASAGEGSHPLLNNRLVAVLLLTDGQDANSGNLAHHDANIARAAALGLSIHTFGYGQDHDSSLLHHLSAQTSGTFAYVEDASQVSDAFAACVGGMTSCVTRDMALEIFATESCYITSIESSYTHTVSSDGTSGKVSLGTLYAEERREVLVNLRISKTILARAEAARGASECPPTLLTARASYTPLSGGSTTVESLDASLAMGLPLVDEGTLIQPRLIEVDVARNRERATAALKRILALHDVGELAAAAALLRATTEELTSSRSVEHPVVMALVDELETLRSRSAMSEGINRNARAAALSAISTHSTQRFAGGSSGTRDSAPLYRVSAQLRMLQSARFVGAPPVSILCPTGSVGPAVRSLGPRPRSNYDRAMAAEVRMESQDAAENACVLVTGTITVAWSACQFLADGLYDLAVHTLGCYSGSSGFSGALPFRSHDIVESGGNVPALRIAFGNVLFGGSRGLNLRQLQHHASKKCHADEVGIDFDSSIRLCLRSTSVEVFQHGHSLALVERELNSTVPSIGVSGCLPLLLGLKNASVLVTRVDGTGD